MVFGLFLARLHRGGTDGPEEVAAPDDVWAAFEASLSGDEVFDVPRPEGTFLNTVGGMAVGEHGFVSSREAAVDVNGRMWLASTAVVHPVSLPGRVAVRRDAAGYHLQRHNGPVGLWDGGMASMAVRVRVESRFD